MDEFDASEWPGDPVIQGNTVYKRYRFYDQNNQSRSMNLRIACQSLEISGLDLIAAKRNLSDDAWLCICI